MSKDKAKFTRGKGSMSVPTRSEGAKSGEKAKFTTATSPKPGNVEADRHGPSFPAPRGGERAAGTKHSD